MKIKVLKRNLTYFIILSFLVITSCFRQNEFPATPEISFNQVVFSDAPDYTPDTLSIAIDFQDGDGDLGLDSQSDIAHPYNSKYYFTWADGIQRPVKFTVYYLFFDDIAKIYYSAFFDTEADMNAFASTYLSSVSYSTESYPGIPYSIKVAESRLGANNIFLQNLITYESKRTIAELDTFPSFTHPYNCLNWQITENQDTLYYQSNLNHNNILVDFYVDQGNGDFTKFDWETDIFKYPQCNTSFDGRFPIMVDTDKKKALEGTIKYNMTSIGFTNVFSIKRIKMRVQIIDRALNRSNVIETPPFRLEDITK